MLSRRKKFFFSIIPVVTLLCLLMGLEFFLRHYYPSNENQLTINVTYDGIDWYQTNRSFLKKYFPANAPLIPEFKPMLFKRHKDTNTVRIFCLGESSMFGTPYEMTATIPGIVRKQLRHIFPSKEFEVINFGASAINSNVIRDIVSRLPEYSPDLILVYMGHNEFYGPDGIGASWLEKQLPAVTRWKYSARDLRLMQIIQSWFRREEIIRKNSGQEGLMYQVSQGNHVTLNSKDAERVFSLFKSNLSEILETFQQKHIPVIVSDVSSNLLFPPFASDSLGENNVEKNIPDLFSKGNYEEILATLFRLRPHDTTNAFCNYWIGKSLLATGRIDSAKSYLVQARDNDLLKFRAPQRINEIIRSVCKNMNVGCVSTDSSLAEVSFGHIPGDSVFWEHLHPRLNGYYLIANLLVKNIIESNFACITTDKRFNTFNLLPLSQDSLSICWQDLAYADLSIQHLTGKWPFTNYKREPVVLSSADPTMLGIVNDVYLRKLGWDEGVYKSAAYFWSRSMLRQAQTSYDALLEEYPYSFYTQYLLGSLLNSMGRREEALSHYEISVRSNSHYAKSLLDIGLLQVNRGNFEQGINYLLNALQLGKENKSTDIQATACYGLAAAYANKMQTDTALTYIGEALQLRPSYLEVLALKESILHRQTH